MTDKDLSPLQLRILDTYYTDNARKLHRVVDRILSKFGGLTYKDKGDFYSLANEVFADVIQRYDGEQSFDGFLYSCLSNKIMSEITRRNREKRKADRMSISIDTPVGEDKSLTLGDTIADDFDVEKEVLEGNKEEYSSKMLIYLSKLSNLQKEVLKLNIAGYLPNEIREELHINEKEYADCYAAIHSYKNVSVLF